MKILAIIKKQFFSLLNVLVGVDSYPVVAIHHEDFHLAIGLGGMVGEPYLPSHPEWMTPDRKKFTLKIFPYLAASTQNSSFKLNM